MEEIQKFIKDQLSVWPMAAANFRSLKNAEQKNLIVGGIPVKVQHNPERIASTTADIDPESIAARKCFLCMENRPEEQFHIKFDGRKGRRYNVQVNPYPLFPDHLVIARDVHTPQSIWHYFVDMMDFARKYPQYLVFYNGPKSGASAPDHFHFQGCPKDSLPLQVAADRFLDNPGEPLTNESDATLYKFDAYCHGVYALKAKTPKSLAKLFYRLVDCAPMADDDNEPRLNLFIYCHTGEYRCITVLRNELRSHHYFSKGPDHLTMTFGAADMAGHIVCPVKDDFNKINSVLITEVLDEVCITEEDEKMVAWRLKRTQPQIEVGIKMMDEASFEMISDGAGPQRVSVREGRIDYNGVLYDELFFDSRTRSTKFDDTSFIINDGGRVLKFPGALKFVINNGHIEAINRVGLESYIMSVVSSEFPDEAGFQDAKTEVIRKRSEILSMKGKAPSYFGLTFDINPLVRKAIDITWGQVKNY